MNKKLRNFLIGISGAAVIGTGAITVSNIAPTTPQTTVTITDTVSTPIENILTVSFPNLSAQSKVEGNKDLTANLVKIKAGYVAWANGSISQWYAIRDGKGKFGKGYNCATEGFSVCDECNATNTFSVWKDFLFTVDTMNSKVLYTVNINTYNQSLIDSAKKDVEKIHSSIGILQLGAEQKTLAPSSTVVSTYNNIIPYLQRTFPQSLISADTYGNKKWDDALMGVSGVQAGRDYYSVQDTPTSYQALRTYAQGIGAATQTRITDYPNTSVVWLQCAYKNSNPTILTVQHSLYWMELIINAVKCDVKTNSIAAIAEFNLKTLFDKNNSPTAPYYAIMEVSNIFGKDYQSSSINAEGLVTIAAKGIIIILNPNEVSTTLNNVVVNGTTITNYTIKNYSGKLTDKQFTVTNGNILPSHSFTIITY